jgi:hypothetical protein
MDLPVRLATNYPRLTRELIGTSGADRLIISAGGEKITAGRLYGDGQGIPFRGVPFPDHRSLLH